MSSSSVHPMVDVLVLGAGAAGLAAASTLHEAGASFRVLEARDRLGGRAYSVPVSDGSALERGGQLIHGARAATWEHVVRHGIATHGVDSRSEIEQPTPVFAGGVWELQ